MIPKTGVLELGCGHINHDENALFLITNCLLYSQAKIRQTSYMYIVMMTKYLSTKFCNFMTPSAGVFVLGQGHVIYMVKIHYIFQEPSSLHPGIDQTNQVLSNDDQGRVYQYC